MGRRPKRPADYRANPEFAEVPGTLDVVNYGRMKMSGIELFVFFLVWQHCSANDKWERQIANGTANGKWQLAVSDLFLGTANGKWQIPRRHMAML